jgi:hypothetical protein
LAQDRRSCWVVAVDRGGSAVSSDDSGESGGRFKRRRGCTTEDCTRRVARRPGITLEAVLTESSRPPGAEPDSFMKYMIKPKLFCCPNVSLECSSPFFIIWPWSPLKLHRTWPNKDLVCPLASSGQCLEMLLEAPRACFFSLETPEKQLLILNRLLELLVHEPQTRLCAQSASIDVLSASKYSKISKTWKQNQNTSSYIKKKKNL